MMAFHHRKSLISGVNKKLDSDSCYLCYVCPENCYISPPPPQKSSPPPPELSYSTKNQIPTVLILMLCVLGVAFLILSYLTISRYRNSRRRNSPPPPEILTANFADENQGPILDHPVWFIRTVGLPQSVIDSIATFAYRKGDGLIDGGDCAVCLSDFQTEETLRLLPKCSHAFHLGCIDTWLRSHRNCPVCRAPIVEDDRAGAGADAVEPSSSSSGPGEPESRVEIERDDEPVINRADGASYESPEIEKLRAAGDRTESLDRDLQRVRRSVSMDLSWASIIYEVGDEGSSDRTRLKAAEKRNSGGGGRVKRSFSFSGKRKINTKITV